MQKKFFGYFWMNDASAENSREHRNPKLKSHLAGELPTHFLKSDFQKDSSRKYTPTPFRLHAKGVGVTFKMETSTRYKG